MDHQTDNPVRQPVSRLKVFGVGKAGISVINRLMQTGLTNADFVAIGTDAATLAGAQAPRKLLLESKRLRGLGTGGDPARGAKAAEENLSELKTLCQGGEIVFVVTGLGGGTGTGVSPVVARVARQAGALVTGFTVLPFACEGDTRGLNASRGLESLKAAADGVICLPNEKVLKLIDEQAGVADAFNKAGELLAEGVRAVWRLMNLKGPIELNFEDLCAVLKDRHSECLFAVAEGSGAERVGDALAQLHAHPLLDEGRDLECADAVLVSVVSGSELSMAEVNRLMADLNKRCSRARVAMGVGSSEEFAARLVVTVIASCRGRGRKGTAQDTDDTTRAGIVADEASDELFPRLIDGKEEPRTSHSRFVPPPPELSPDRLQQAGSRHRGGRMSSGRLRQEQLPLEVVSKGRFEKGEPTVLDGQDLDVPTYVRLGAALN